MYSDHRVQADEHAVTIRGYSLFGGTRILAYSDVDSVTEFGFGAAGRWRLIGAGFNSPRRWFAWDPGRRSKSVGFAFDVGRFWVPTVTPDDPAAFREVVAARVPVSS
ncbi:MAG: hypothetical protein ACR2N7_08720 [Acidimicrobiia bacterium]